MILELLRKLYQARDTLADRLFRHGCDFAAWVEPIEAADKSKRNRYQPTGPQLRLILKTCAISKDDAILDIGCGKGKAMYDMARFPFGRVEGYDYNEQLVKIANENFKKLGSRCKAFQADANTFSDYDDYNFFYAYNPFPDPIFSKMLEQLQQSLERKPRKCTLIYLNPECHDQILQKTDFRMTGEHKGIISWFTIRKYENL